MSNNEIMLGYQFLESRLSADTPLQGYAPGGITRGLAPPDTAYPFAIMGFMAGTDAITMNGVRLIVEAVYQVKVIGPASITPTLISAANRIDAALGGQDGLRNIPITGGYILSCYRDGPLQNDELINAVLHTNIGGLYRLQIEST